MLGIIPAAGKGTRMLPFTRAQPKELVMFGEKPVIERTLDSLRDSGIIKVFIIAGHKKGALMDYVGNGSLFGTKVSYVHQEETKGLGHAVLCTKDYIEDLKEDDFVVFLGDTIIEPSVNLKEMIEVHKKNNSFATILVEEVTNPEHYGVVKLDGNQIKEMFEKPKTDEEKKKFECNGKFYAVAGLYILNKKIFEYLEKTKPGKGNEIQLTDAIQAGIKNNENAYATILKGKRIDVGNWNYLKEVRDYFKNMSDNELEEKIKERNQKMELLKNGSN